MALGRATWIKILATLAIALALLLPARLGIRPAVAAGSGLPANQLPLSFLKSVHRVSKTFTPPSLRNGQGHARFGETGIDSVANFNTHFMLPVFDSAGNPNKHWYPNTVGNPPALGGTTTINAPVIPLTIELMNVDGHGKNVFCDASKASQQALSSPLFQNSTYSSSSTPTQWADAIQRAEFYNGAKPDWHTMLAVQPKSARVVQMPPGSYAYVANPDGSCVVGFVDINTFGNLVFPSTSTDTSTVLGAAEHSGEITTKDITTLLMGNVLPYFGDPSQAFLGFHTYDSEPGDAGNGNRERRYVLNLSGWLDESLFGPILADASTLTHEMSEIYADPFVASDNIHDVTPWWLDPTGSTCQNDLEVGDVIEFLPYAQQVSTITMNGMTYHDQNEALIQWFEGQPNSDAIGGAFSYPDTTALTSPLVSLKANCAP